jgi:hypothetical protein
MGQRSNEQETTELPHQLPVFTVIGTGGRFYINSCEESYGNFVEIVLGLK